MHVRRVWPLRWRQVAAVQPLPHAAEGAAHETRHPAAPPLQPPHVPLLTGQLLL